MKNKPTEEQRKILENDRKKLIVSASAGSGKTFVVIEYLIDLICNKKIPVSRLLVLTFTKAAAGEMKTRLFKAILEEKATPFLLEQLDDISISDISTIDAFCEKIIKRHIDKLDIDNNFKVLDEKEAQKLKFIAFNRVFENLAEQGEDFFNEIYFAFKHNKEQIYKCMIDLQNFFDSNDDPDLADKYIDNFENFYSDSLKYLNSAAESILFRARQLLAKPQTLPPAYQAFKDSLSTIANHKLDEDFFENCKWINSLVFPVLPRNKIDSTNDKEILTQARDILKELSAIAENYQSNEELYGQFGKGSLSKGLLKMQKLFACEYKKLKEDKGGLDFADLEKEVKKLLSNADVLEELQKSYGFIFIDEYQDTNTLQESIIKLIAEKGYFVAVGDLKQGIYGFRNASMEIMQKDINDFGVGEDSQALYLNGNFRSDQRVLSFVNDVFDKIMTEDSVGIDYKNTSTLVGKVDFKKSSLPSVAVDIAIANEEESTPSGVYSVKEDSISSSYKYKNEVTLIASRVEQILKSNIYDAKLGAYRKATQGDIAILFRSRSQVMQECARFLQEKGFDVLADLKQTLLEDGEVLSLVSLLKLSLNPHDDISLVSLLSSWFGSYSLDEIALLREKDKNRPFWMTFDEINDEKVEKFREMLENFKFDCFARGITKALEKLFNDSDYYLYINTLPDKNAKFCHIQEFLKLIASNDYDFNIPGLLEQLENIENVSSLPVQSSNAITITTIHATKGLEFPIVILAGCGEKLGKIYNKPYIISTKFGLGTYLFDYENNIRLVSPVYLASKMYKRRREFIDEIMIFYVALTRAQNHLFIVGSGNLKSLAQNKEIFKCNNYLDLILYSKSDAFKEQLFSQEHIETENYQYRVVNEVEDIQENNAQELDFNSTLKLNDEVIKEYIDFKYKDAKYCKINYKNSVSGILKLEEENSLEEIYQNRVEKKVSRADAIERGNAYHEALKLIDFAKVLDRQSLYAELENIKDIMTEGYFELLDSDIIYKNIMQIKKVIGAQPAIKERQFIMQAGLNEVLGLENNQKIIVQGIVDLFSLGEKNILIDYKYTSLNDEKKLLERYDKQLELYAKAIEKAFNIKLDKIYLLSLSNAKLIEKK